MVAAAALLLDDDVQSKLGGGFWFCREWKERYVAECRILMIAGV